MEALIKLITFINMNSSLKKIIALNGKSYNNAHTAKVKMNTNLSIYWSKVCSKMFFFLKLTVQLPVIYMRVIKVLPWKQMLPSTWYTWFTLTWRSFLNDFSIVEIKALTYLPWSVFIGKHVHSWAVEQKTWVLTEN